MNILDWLPVSQNVYIWREVFALFLWPVEIQQDKMFHIKVSLSEIAVPSGKFIWFLIFSSPSSAPLPSFCRIAQPREVNASWFICPVTTSGGFSSRAVHNVSLPGRGMITVRYCRQSTYTYPPLSVHSMSHGSHSRVLSVCLLPPLRVLALT